MILLHYFISHEEEMLLFSKSDHIFNALSALHLTCNTGEPQFDVNQSQHLFDTETAITGHTSGVSGVDDAEDAGIAVLSGCVDGSLELSDIQTPTLVLVQVVTDLHGTQVRQGGRVQRVLRDGDHHSCAITTLATHQQLQHGLGLGGEGGRRKKERRGREKGGKLRW